MHWFLKCYYGYKNFWDEILFFGIVKDVFERFNLSRLTVEVWDKVFFDRWVRDNISLLASYVDKIDVVQIGQYRRSDFADTFKIFGGGEVFTDARSFPYDGRNYLLKYHRDIIKKNFVLMGGIGKPTKLSTKMLYRMVLPYAQQIVVREQTSYDIVKRYTNKVVLHHDFSLETLQNFVFSFETKKIWLTTPSGDTIHDNYIVVNIHPHIRKKPYQQQVFDACQRYHDYQKIYMPCDINYDTIFFAELKERFPDMILRDWTTCSLDQTLAMLAGARFGIGARLHFLYVLKVAKVPFEALVYQEKVKKLILDAT